MLIQEVRCGVSRVSLRRTFRLSRSTEAASLVALVVAALSRSPLTLFALCTRTIREGRGERTNHAAAAEHPRRGGSHPRCGCPVLRASSRIAAFSSSLRCTASSSWSAVSFSCGGGAEGETVSLAGIASPGEFPSRACTHASYSLRLSFCAQHLSHSLLPSFFMLSFCLPTANTRYMLHAAATAVAVVE